MSLVARCEVSLCTNCFPVYGEKTTVARDGYMSVQLPNIRRSSTINLINKLQITTLEREKDTLAEGERKQIFMYVLQSTFSIDIAEDLSPFVLLFYPLCYSEVCIRHFLFSPFLGVINSRSEACMQC